VKDYDNVERTCVINTLVKYFLDDDNSRQIFTMDLAAEADANRTEVYLMEPSAFMDFLTGLDYSLYGEDLRDVMNGHA
jgi:ferredoxin-NADP reductase